MAFGELMPSVAWQFLFSVSCTVWKDLNRSASLETEFKVLILKTESLISVYNCGYHRLLARKGMKNGANMEQFWFCSYRN